MAKYKVTGPDGNTYQFDGPDNATEQEVMGFLDSQFSTEGQYNRAEPSDQLAHDTSGALRSAGNTLSFGLTDYAAGVGQMADDWWNDKDTSKSVVQYRDAEAGKRKEWERMNPVSGTIAGISGAVLNPANKNLGKWAANTPKLLGKMVRGSVAGGAASGLQSAGSSEGTLGERATQTAVGTGMGGVFGAAVPPLVKAVTTVAPAVTRWATNLAKKATGGNAQSTKAARKISQALQRDGLTPDQAAQRIKELGPEARLIDVGPNTRALGYTVNAVPGKGKKTLVDHLTRRQEGYRDSGQNLVGGQTNRMASTVNKLIPEDYYNVKLATEAERKFLGRLYEGAKAGDDLVDVTKLLRDLEVEIASSRGGIQSGLQRVKRLIGGPKISPLLDERALPRIGQKVQSLHQAKVAIDDLMQGPGITSMGKITKARIRNYQSQLIEAIENSGEAGKLYKAGRMGTAGQWRIDDALEEGSGFMRGTSARSPRALKDYMAGLKSEEVEAFKIGAARAIKEKLTGLNVRQDAAKKVIDIPDLEAKIKLAFGDEKTFQKFIKMATSERTMNKTYNKTLHGSETAERQEALKDAIVDPGKIIQGMQDTKSGNWLRGAFNMIHGVKDAVFDPEPLSAEMAKQLLSRNPEALRKTFQGMQFGQNLDNKTIEYLTRMVPVPAGRLSERLQRPR